MKLTAETSNLKLQTSRPHHARMRGKRRIFLAAALMVAIGVSVLLVWQTEEPKYKGKRLSVWIEGYNYRDYTSQHGAADEAVRHLGTNALPTLLKKMRATDSELHTKLRILARRFLNTHFHMAAYDNDLACEGFKALGPIGAPAVPSLIEIYERNYSQESQFNAAEALSYLGPAASAAIPSLLSGAKTNSDVPVRFRSIMTVGAIHERPQLAVPVLIDFLKDSGEDIRWRAADALGNYGTNAALAVPSLLKLVSDTNFAVRNAADEALQKIDPEAAAKAGVK